MEILHWHFWPTKDITLPNSRQPPCFARSRWLHTTILRLGPLISKTCSVMDSLPLFSSRHRDLIFLNLVYLFLDAYPFNSQHNNWCPFPRKHIPLIITLHGEILSSRLHTKKWLLNDVLLQRKHDHHHRSLVCESAFDIDNRSDWSGPRLFCRGCTVFCFSSLSISTPSFCFPRYHCCCVSARAPCPWRPSQDPFQRWSYKSL